MRTFLFEAADWESGIQWLEAMLTAAGRDINAAAWTVLQNDKPPQACREWIEAAIEGDVLAIKSMLADGEDINSLDLEKRSALHWCCYELDLSGIEFLVEHGARMNAADKDGVTPFLLAVHALGHSGEHEKLLRYLIASGANPLMTDANGFNALHYAAYYGNARVAMCIVRALKLLPGAQIRYLPKLLHADSTRLNVSGDIFDSENDNEAELRLGVYLQGKTPFEIATCMLEAHLVRFTNEVAIANYRRVRHLLGHYERIVHEHPNAHSWEVVAAPDGSVAKVIARTVREKHSGQTAFRTTTWTGEGTCP